MMDIPPGFVYFSKVLPRLFIPLVLVYFSWTWIQNHDLVQFKVPPWLIMLIAFVTKPILFLVGKSYAKWMDCRAASAHGAVVPPYIPQSAMNTIKEMKEMVLEGYPADTFWRWTEKYGEVVLVDILTEKFLVTNEPSHVKAMLATQFDSFVKGYFVVDSLKSLLGDGVFNVNGDIWKFHRSITRPFFTRERISDFEIYNHNYDLSLRAVGTRLAEGYSVDVQDLFGRFTLDSAAEFLFGTTIGSLTAELPYPPAHTHKNTEAYHKHPSNIFVDAFDKGLDSTVARLGLGEEWALFEFWGDKVKPLRKVVDTFTEPIIQHALANRKQKMAQTKGTATHEEPTTLLEDLVNQTQDPQMLKDELLNLLVAGRDTTMCLLTFSIYMLSQYPEVEDRLRREIFRTVGTSAPPDYGQIRELKYLRAFLNEVLRLYPPVPWNGRMSADNVIWPSDDPNKPPIYVPKHTECTYSVLNIQRRTDLWGPDALEFDPDRFLDERLHKYLIPNPFIFCPFNAGPRICLGQQFAYHEASYYLIRFLQTYSKFTLDELSNISPPAAWALGEGRKPREKIHPSAHLTMYVKGGLWVRMKQLG